MDSGFIFQLIAQFLTALLHEALQVALASTLKSDLFVDSGLSGASCS